MHIRPNVAMSISIEELAASLDKQEIYQIETMNSFLLSANVNALRIVLFNDGRALVHGTANVVHARQVYKRLLGYMEIKLLS
ncbi:thiamine/molybdopterin biosynthesis MoeB-like protein [compost metagenome]